MSYPQICCCFLLFTVSPLLSAQYPSLATVGGLIGFPAVINNGDNVTFQFDIQNVGDANFDGDLYVDYIVNDIFYPYTNPESVFEDYDVKFDGTDEPALTPSATYQVSHSRTIQISPNHFQMGKNIVVLWPAGEINDDANTPIMDGKIAADTILPAADSIRFEFDIYALGNNQPNYANAPQLVYVAAQQQIFVQTKAGTSIPQEIQLFDNLGRQIAKYTLPLPTISVQMLPNALYIAQIKTQDGKIYRLKFVKQ